MDTDLKTRWIKALRSGDYAQAREVLLREDHDGDRAYCCLGVLCDIVDPDGWKRHGDRIHALAARDGDILSNDALDQLALDPWAQQTLAELNDSGEPFETIADLIEAGDINV